MTEPVARASARRSVRVAVALVAGQAVLCAVIGWVTLGPGGSHRPSGAAATVEPLAGRPLVIPTPGAAPAPRPLSSSAPASSAPARSSKPQRSTSSRVRTSTSRPAGTTTSAAATRGPVTAPSPLEQPALQLPTPAPAPDDDVQSPVRLLTDCAPAGALGLTADGISVRCVQGSDGTLVWQRDGRAPVDRSPAAG